MVYVCERRVSTIGVKKKMQNDLNYFKTVATSSGNICMKNISVNPVSHVLNDYCIVNIVILKKLLILSTDF